MPTGLLIDTFGTEDGVAASQGVCLASFILVALLGRRLIRSA